MINYYLCIILGGSSMDIGNYFALKFNNPQALLSFAEENDITADAIYATVPPMNSLSIADSYGKDNVQILTSFPFG